MFNPSEGRQSFTGGGIGEHEVEVLAVWSPTPTTRAIRLARPRSFEFQTSQAVRLVLSGPEGDAARPMSIASGAARPYLEFAARRSDSGFKRAFFTLAPGDRVRVIGPVGHFLVERERPSVLFAGGIGITPFRSMLQTLADEGGPRAPVLLVYACRTRDEVAFKEELDGLAGDVSGVDVRYSVSRAAPDATWPHPIGPIDGEVVRRIVTARRDAVHFVAGPPSFARAVGVELLQAGIERASVRMELFRGYSDDDGTIAAGDPLIRPPGPPSWDGVYRTQPVEQMPWFYAPLDPDLVRGLARHDVAAGRFLDVGTGPGTQAIELARRGFAVTATDVSPAAIEGAAARARAAGVLVDFRVDDVLASALEGTFDYVLDRGCFHVLPAEQRDRYLATLHARLRPGGLLFLKCFSDEEGEGGPYQLAPGDVAAAFAPRFAVLSTERTSIQGPLTHGRRALFCVLRRD